MAKQYTKKQIEIGLKLKIAGDLNVAKSVILYVYRHQTASEKAAGITSDLNGIGFTGRDAEILSAFAERIKSDSYFSPRMNAIVLRCAPKYWRQFLPFLREDALPGIAALAKPSLTPNSPNWENSEIARLCR